MTPEKTLPRLPPLPALRAFESAARHNSFSRAATELSLTHGAIGHQVRALEDALGVALASSRIASPSSRESAARARRRRIS